MYSFALLPSIPLAFYLPLVKNARSYHIVITTNNILNERSNLTDSSIHEIKQPLGVSSYSKYISSETILFFVVIFISGILLSVCDLYRGPFLASIGASDEFLGISITMTSLTEAPSFYLVGPLLKHLDIYVVQFCILLIYAARMFWYSVLTNPLWSIPSELLHGVTYAVGWASAAEHVSTLLPPEMSSTAQGMLSAVQFGGGISSGALIGGWLLTEYGDRVMFQFMCGLAFCGAVLLLRKVFRLNVRI